MGKCTDDGRVCACISPVLINHLWNHGVRAYDVDLCCRHKFSSRGARYGAAAGDISGNRTRHYMDCSGILSATKTSAILIPITDGDITLWYDSGPGTIHIKDSCPPKNSYGIDMIELGDRIGVRVRVHYSPIINFLKLNGFDIVSENARTILVNIDIQN